MTKGNDMRELIEAVKELTAEQKRIADTLAAIWDFAQQEKAQMRGGR